MKRLVGLIVAVSLVLLTSGSTMGAVVFKYGHANAVTYPYHIAGLAFAKALEEATKGSMVIQIHPMGQLGGERDITEGLQLGTVDFQATSIGVTGNFIPALNAFNLPFLFKGPDHFIKVMRGPIGERIMREVVAQGEKVGLKVLGIGGPSFRMPMNNVRPITSVADFKGLRIRTMEVPIHMAAYRALGATPVPLPFGELYTALQTGVVDGNENGPATLNAMKFYEVQKYLTTLPLVSNAGIFLMSLKTWNKLTPEQQKAVMECAPIWSKTMDDECLKQDEASLSEMAAKGLKITRLTNVRPFIDAMKPVYDQYLPQFPKAIADAVNEILALD